MTEQVPEAARRLAGRLVDAFETDRGLAEQQTAAQQRLQAANERLWSGLRPEGLAAIYGDHPQFEAVALEASVHSDCEVLASKDPLGAIQQVHWQIHDAHNDYQTAAEDRRQLAADIGELIGQLVDELQGIGWTEDQARNVNVHKLAATVGR